MHPGAAALGRPIGEDAAAAALRQPPLELDADADAHRRFELHRLVHVHALHTSLNESNVGIQEATEIDGKSEVCTDEERHRQRFR